MSNKNFDDRLLKLLEQEVLKERWKKKIKITGIVIRKSTTKKGSFKIMLKTRKSEYEVIIPQYKEDIFELARNINEGDIIRAIGDRQVSGLIFCDKIEKLNKALNEEQIKLLK